MSSIKRNLRYALQYLPVRASFCMAGIALACAASAQTPQDTGDGGKSVARIDFASCPKPEYPSLDARDGHQGTVTLGYLVDVNGRVKDSKITRSSGFMRLDQAAQIALAKCSFHPALENGKPVQKWAHVKYVWALR